MDRLAPFVGSWRLSRVIVDHRAGKDMLFHGTAEFIRRSDGLVYFETGHWTKSDWGAMFATRRYLWQEEDGRIAVLYEDGRPFHSFALSTDGQSHGGHDCAPDRYDVTYRFHLPERWEAEWRVTGPAKDYTSRTHYEHGAVGGGPLQ